MSDNESDKSDDEPFDSDGEDGASPEGQQLSEKEQKKRDKLALKWRVFLDFLLRQVAIVTFKYNTFEHDETTGFMLALEKAETFARLKVEKMKKSKDRTKYVDDETRKITCLRQMKACVELLEENRFYTEANRVKTYMDFIGRMKGLSMIAGGYYKWLKKDKKLQGLDQAKHYVDYWKGFCVRGYDYTQLSIRGASPGDMDPLEAQYKIWLGVLRTGIFLAQKFLKRSCDMTGLPMMNEDEKVQIQHLTAAQFVIAKRIEEVLAKKVATETKTFLLGSPLAPQKTNQNDMQLEKGLEDINPEFLKPIPADGFLLELPSEVPKEKKGKKGKKGGKKSGRSSRASGKKKKKK